MTSLAFDGISSASCGTVTPSGVLPGSVPTDMKGLRMSSAHQTVLRQKELLVSEV